MANGIDQPSIVSFLETNYGPPKLEALAFKDNPLLNWIPKDESCGGDYWAVRIDHTNVQGIGPDFATAKANADATNFAGTKFLFDYVPVYSVATLDNLAIERAQGGGHSVIDPLQRAIKGAMESLGDQLETMLFATGFGEIGQVGAISGATITLLDAGDAIEKVEKGHVHAFSASLAANVLRGTGGGSAQYLTVSSVDRDLGKITYTANVSTVTGGGGSVTVNDYIFIKGFRQDSATPTAQAVFGLGAHIPATAPTAGDSFGGKDRSVDPIRLSGYRYSVSAGESTRSALISLVMKGARYGAKPDVIWTGWGQVENLIKELGSVTYVDMESSSGSVGLRAIEIQTPKGPVKVMASSKCSDKRAYSLQRDTWKLGSVNGAVIRPTLKNNKILDDSSSDGLQIRYRFFGQMANFAPFRNGVAIFP